MNWTCFKEWTEHVYLKDKLNMFQGMNWTCLFKGQTDHVSIFKGKTEQMHFKNKLNIFQGMNWTCLSQGMNWTYLFQG